MKKVSAFISVIMVLGSLLCGCSSNVATSPSAVPATKSPAAVSPAPSVAPTVSPAISATATVKPTATASPSAAATK